MLMKKYQKLQIKFILWYNDNTIDFTDRELLLLEKARFIKDISINNNFIVTEYGYEFIKENSCPGCVICKN